MAKQSVPAFVTGLMDANKGTKGGAKPMRMKPAKGKRGPASKAKFAKQQRAGWKT